MIAALDELLGRPVSMRAMALLRILIGPVVLLHLSPFLAEAWDGRTYRDAFYEPYASWYPELPGALYVAVLCIGAVAAVVMTIGWRTRIATATVFAVATYNVFLSTTHMHNNRAYLLIVLAALAVAPCGRELSIDAWRRARSGRAPLPTSAPAWPLWLLRFEAAAVYGASGLSKLVDPDWFGGTVTWDRVMRTCARLEASVLPDWAITVLADRAFHTAAAKVIVATELFIAIGLWWRPTRYATIWIAVCFHVAIHLSARVEVFSYLAIAALVIWAVPSTRDRVLLVDPDRHRPLVGTTRALDWLGRFRIVAGPAGSSVRVVDRDGSVRDGPAAVRFVLSRLPVTAWFALPTLLLPVESRSVPARLASSRAWPRHESRGPADPSSDSGWASRPRWRRAAARRRAGVRRARPTRALSRGHGRQPRRQCDCCRRLVHPQPRRRWHVALRVRRRRRSRDRLGVQRGASCRGGDGLVPGRLRRRSRRPGERRPGRGVGASASARARRLDRRQLRGSHRRRGVCAACRRAGRAAADHG